MATCRRGKVYGTTSRLAAELPEEKFIDGIGARGATVEKISNAVTQWLVAEAAWPATRVP